MNKHILGLISVIIMTLSLLFGTSYASNISVTNEITAPLNKTIWTYNSKGLPNEALVAINLTNEVNSREPATVILAIDCSGSMIESDPNKFRVKAAKDFVNLLALDDIKDKVGVILWNDAVIGSLDPTENLDTVKNYLNLANASGFTCISEPLRAADLLFKNATTKGKVLILLSDGIAECYVGENFKIIARQMRSNGVSIYAIGLGDSNVDELRNIGEFYHVSRPDTMPHIFRDIATKVKVSLTHVKVDYYLPKNLEPYNIFPYAAYSSTERMNILTWYLRDTYYKQKLTMTFKIRSANPGNYTMPLPMNSTISYFDAGDGFYEDEIPPTNLLVKFRQYGNDADEESNYIQLSQPLEPEEANQLFGMERQNNYNHPASS